MWRDSIRGSWVSLLRSNLLPLQPVPSSHRCANIHGGGISSRTSPMERCAKSHIRIDARRSCPVVLLQVWHLTHLGGTHLGGRHDRALPRHSRQSRSFPSDPASVRRRSGLVVRDERRTSALLHNALTGRYGPAAALLGNLLGKLDLLNGWMCTLRDRNASAHTQLVVASE